MRNRIFLFAFAGFLLLSISAAAAAPAPAVPAMKAEATVSGDIVRIGDLIENAGPAAAAPAFHAPELGATGTIQTHRVIDAAIVRTARLVSVADLETAVAEAAARHLGLDDPADISVRLDRDVRALMVEPDTKDAPRIARFAYDTHSGRFDGVVEVPGSLAVRRTPARISGTLMETAEIVVVARALTRGETLRASDILMERRPRAEVAADVATRTAAVVGQAARRALRAGQTLRAADLMKPDLVGRNETVTILFEVPGITLTARGKALEAGAEGETVSVVNPQSKRTLHATVRGPGLVVVGRGRTATANATGAVQ